MPVIQPQMKKPLALIAGLILAAQVAWAGEFKPPERLVRAGKVYELKYQSLSPRGATQYDYTTNGEAADEWTTLVRIKFDPRHLQDLSKWIIFMDNSLERTVPKPVYSVYVSGEHGFARYVLNPIPTSPTYESDVYKTYHTNACNGFLIYQYSVKYPPAADQSDAGQLAKLKEIVAENERIADEIEQEAWIPPCL